MVGRIELDSPYNGGPTLWGRTINRQGFQPGAIDRIRISTSAQERIGITNLDAEVRSGISSGIHGFRHREKN
jgi:hypothetical protein